MIARRLSRLGWGLVLWGGTTILAWAQSWQRVDTPSFTLFSSAKPSETRRIAEEFQQFVLALGQVVPADPKRLPPLTIVIFGRERDFKDFWPRRFGKPNEVAGFFARRSGWSVFGLYGGRSLSDEARSTVFHEGVHWYLSAFDHENPAWLEEGLAELFSTFAVQRDKQQWGRAIEYHVSVLREFRLMPMERLLLLNRSDSLFDEQQRTGVFYAQSWLFVHYWLFGAHAHSRGALNDYLRQYRAGLAPAEAFQRAFGATYEEVDQHLRRYVEGGRYYVASRPLQPMETSLEAIPATEREVNGALARLALGGSNWALAERYIGSLMQAAGAGVEAHELQGALASARDDEEGVLAAYKEATSLGSKDYWVWYELAARWNDRHRGLNGGSMDEATARLIANRYEQSINLNPHFLPSYQGLARILWSVEAVTTHDRDFLELGAKLYPADVFVQAGLATLDRKAGRSDEALQRLAAVRERSAAPRDAGEVSAREYAEFLEDSWRRDDTSSKVQALLKAGQHTEALQLLDEVLAGDLRASDRVSWAQYRLRVRVDVGLAQAYDALREKRWADGREVLQPLLDTVASQPELRRRVQQRLDELNRTEQFMEGIKRADEAIRGRRWSEARQVLNELRPLMERQAGWKRSVTSRLERIEVMEAGSPPRSVRLPRD